MKVSDAMVDAAMNAKNDHPPRSSPMIMDPEAFKEAIWEMAKVDMRRALEAALAVAPAPADDAFEDALASFVAASRALDDIFRSSEAATGAGPEVLDHWLKLSKHFYERSEAARRAVLDLHQQQRNQGLRELRVKVIDDMNDLFGDADWKRGWRQGAGVTLSRIDALLNQKGGE